MIGENYHNVHYLFNKTSNPPLSATRHIYLLFIIHTIIEGRLIRLCPITTFAIFSMV